MYLVVMYLLLVKLAFEHEVGEGSSEGGRASDAGRITHTHTHSFCETQILLLTPKPPLLSA